MPRHDHYRRCQLERPAERGGVYKLQTYVPAKVVEKALAENKPIRIRDNANEPWSPPWEIIHAGEREDGERVEANANEWRHHRDTTDI